MSANITQCLRMHVNVIDNFEDMKCKLWNQKNWMKPMFCLTDSSKSKWHLLACLRLSKDVMQHLILLATCSKHPLLSEDIFVVWKNGWHVFFHMATKIQVDENWTFSGVTQTPEIELVPHTKVRSKSSNMTRTRWRLLTEFPELQLPVHECLQQPHFRAHVWFQPSMALLMNSTAKHLQPCWHWHQLIHFAFDRQIAVVCCCWECQKRKQDLMVLQISCTPQTQQVFLKISRCRLQNLLSRVF